MITVSNDRISLPLKRRWSAISENIVRGSATLSVSRPASANDAHIFRGDTMVWNDYFEKGNVYQQERDHYLEKHGPSTSQSMTERSTGITQEENAPQGVKKEQWGGNNIKIASGIEPHVDNSTCLCYPKLWRAVGFDPLGLGHQGLFTLRIYYQLGGQDLSEFRTLFAKIRDFYHQLRSYPVTPGIVYIPSDRRQVNTDTIWMTVNTNLDHLEYYAYHGRYAPISPSLEDKLTPLPHTMFNIDSSFFQGQQTWSKGEKTTGSLLSYLPTTTSWSDYEQRGYQKPVHPNQGITQYQQYPPQYQLDTKASNLKNETVWESYHQDSKVQLPNAPNKVPSSPQEQNELKRRSTQIPQVPRMWPSSHVAADGKRRKVEVSKTTLPDVQQTDISRLNQGTQHYLPYKGKQPQETPSFTSNDRDAQTSGDYDRKLMPPLITVSQQAYSSVGARARTTQEVLDQKQSQHYWPPPGRQPTSDHQDVSWVKQEPLDDTDQALDLSVCSTANCHAEGSDATARNVVRNSNGADYQQTPGEHGKVVLAGKSHVFSLRNMIDKNILQQFPGNTGNGHVSLKCISEVETTFSNGNRNYPSDERKDAHWDKGLQLQHRFHKPTVPYDQQVSHTIHSKRVLPANGSSDTGTREQRFSSCENGLVSNKSVTENSQNDGPGLPRSRMVNSQKASAQPSRANQVESDESTKANSVVQKEPEKPRKMEVPDMKVITEVHSTLCHMLAGLVGYPLSLVTNMGLGDHSDQPESKSTTTKRISKMGAKILSQFLAEGTDCYDKVTDMINDQYDVSDEEVVQPKHIEDDQGSTQWKLLSNMRSCLNVKEHPKASPKYIPNGTSDILAQMLSGFKCYSTELQSFSAINPKLDTDRDSEGESTYSCGSECSGCDSCRGQTRADETWEPSFNLLPGVTFRQPGNPDVESHIKKTERCAVLKRHPLHSYRMPLPARKRHIFMLQEDENVSIECNHYSEKNNSIIEDQTQTQLHDSSSDNESDGDSMMRDSIEGLNASESTDEQAATGNKSVEKSVSNSTGSANFKAFTPNTDLNSSSVVTNYTDLTNNSISNESSPQEDELSSPRSSILDLSKYRKRKVSLAINSIPSELLIDTDSTLHGAESKHDSEVLLGFG